MTEAISGGRGLTDSSDWDVLNGAGATRVVFNWTDDILLYFEGCAIGRVIQINLDVVAVKRDSDIIFVIKCDDIRIML